MYPSSNQAALADAIVFRPTHCNFVTTSKRKSTKIFTHKHVFQYIILQFECYFAADVGVTLLQVILGLPYDFKIDVWSLGCIMSELLTGKVLFQNDSVQTMLARMMGVIGTTCTLQCTRAGCHRTLILTG